MPLHPAFAHLPLGLALVLPLVAAFATWRLWKGERPATMLVLALALVLVAGGIATRQTGEEDEERVEKVVPHDVIEEHEQAANFFAGASLLVLALAVATVALGERKQARYVSVGVVAVSALLSTIAIRTGHLGGVIAYEHGGAAAHAAKAPTPAPAPSHD